jgi:hypothetical protein
MPPLFKFHCLLEACYFCETEKLLHSYRYVAKFLHIIKPELKFFDHRDVNFEIIIVDDGSPDGRSCCKYLLKYAPGQLEVFVYAVLFF